MGRLENSSWRFIDLFAGLGGFHQAATPLGGTCVFASEINKDLRITYEQNFKLVPHGDIRDVPISEIPDHEALFAGFPCQPFSKAGKQLGWKDAVRGTLFENIIEIVRAKSPELIILENVAHFVRHDSGNTYKKVREALEDLKYHVFVEQFSPHDFAIPHIRERFYLVATRQPILNFAWPAVDDDTFPLDIATVLDREPQDVVKLPPRIEECLDVWQEFLALIPKDAKLPSFPIWAMEFGANYPYGSDNLNSYASSTLGRYRGTFGCSLAGLSKKEQWTHLPAYARGNGFTFPRWKKAFIRQNREFYAAHQAVLSTWKSKLAKFPPSWQKLEWNCQGEPRVLRDYILQFRASGIRVKRRTTAPSLVAMTSTQIPIIAWEARYMTIKECARLQSMGDLANLPKGEAAMAALGNAVNVTVVSSVLRSALAQISLE